MSNSEEERVICTEDDVTIFFGIDDQESEHKICQFLLNGEIFNGFLTIDDQYQMYLHFGDGEDDFMVLQDHWIINPLQQWEKQIIEGVSTVH